MSLISLIVSDYSLHLKSSAGHWHDFISNLTLLLLQLWCLLAYWSEYWASFIQLECGLGATLACTAQEETLSDTSSFHCAQSFLKPQARMSALRDIERLLNKVLSILFQCFLSFTIRKFSQDLTQICLQQCKPTAFYPIHDGHGKWIISSFLYVCTSRLPAFSLSSPVPWARQHATVFPQIHNS